MTATERAPAGAPAQPAAPAVVAVVVSHDPGPWFEECLRSVVDQDYPNLAVLVIDTASAEDPTARVAAVAPQAFVRRLDRDPGFGAAANEVLDIVEGATFLLFCHDDVALDPDVISVLVDEALRSNAGIVGPKLVRWDDRTRLLAVGETADKTGERAALVERGEVDQEQHDAVRDVFVVPGAVTLVRGDLFTAIGGFDPGIDLLNDDLSLCWRAHVAGARVIVAPDAVVRHQEALGDRSDIAERRRRLVRHRWRTMLVSYSGLHRARVVPQAVVIALVELCYALLVGRRDQARDLVEAYRWNRRRRDEIRTMRARVAASRRVPDREVRRFQTRGFSRLNAYLRGQIGRTGEDRAASATSALSAAWSEGRLLWFGASWLLVLALVGFGSRHLLFGRIPAVGGLAPFDVAPGALFEAFRSGWRTTGLGSASSPPTAFAAFGGLGYLVLGSMGTLRRIVLLGTIVAGAVGTSRLVAPLRSHRARAAGIIAYAAVPVLYNAVGAARWDAMTAAAAAPWLLLSLAKATGRPPFATAEPDRRSSLAGRAAATGVLVAVIATVDPSLALLPVVMAVGLTAGGLLAGVLGGIARLWTVTGLALVAAALAHLPWTLEFVLPGSTWSAFVGPEGAGPGLDASDLVQLATGPVGGPLTVGLFAAGIPGLVIGREWRFAWAVRAWSVVVVSVLVAWAETRDWIPFAVPSLDVLMAPAAAGLGLAAATSVIAFETDVRAYGFGWRQIVGGLAFAGLGLSVLPIVGSTVDGRWELASGGFGSTLAFLDEEPEPFRVLWLGDPDVLPVGSFRLDGVGDGQAYATTANGEVVFTDHWPGAAAGATTLVEVALRRAADGDTDRLGRVLAPMGIRYLIVPTAAAPAPLGGLRRPPAPELVATLARQLDLAEVAVNPALLVYRNEVALPSRAIVSPTTGDGTAAFDVDPAALEGAEPVLAADGGHARYTGLIPAGVRILHGSTFDDDWHLDVGGGEARPVKLFGWAVGFETQSSGESVLSYRTTPLRLGMIALQLVAAGFVVLLAARTRLRERA